MEEEEEDPFDEEAPATAATVLELLVLLRVDLSVSSPAAVGFEFWFGSFLLLLVVLVLLEKLADMGVRGLFGEFESSDILLLRLLLLFVRADEGSLFKGDCAETTAA